MKISEALKEEREKNNISIRKFTAGIIDPTFYSRVEKEDRHIGADPLFRLLVKNNIDINDFFEKIKDEYVSKQKLEKIEIEKNLKDTFNSHDLDLFSVYKDKVLEVDGEEILKLRVIVADTYLKGEKKVDPNVVAKIYKKLDQIENLSESIEAIRLFANTMPIFSDEQLNYLMKQILTKVTKQKLNTKMQERIAILCSNYLHSCYERKIDNEIVVDAYKYLMNLKDIHLVIYKLAGEYDKNLINGNTTEAKKIKNNLVRLGYKDIVEKW